MGKPKIFVEEEDYQDDDLTVRTARGQQTDFNSEPERFWSGSVGQAAALATKYGFIEARYNPSAFKPGQVQFGFAYSQQLVKDANDYFTHNFLVDAIAFWDKIYELKTIKYNLTKTK